jgi:hypothetical protein
VSVYPGTWSRHDTVKCEEVCGVCSEKCVEEEFATGVFVVCDWCIFCMEEVSAHGKIKLEDQMLIRRKHELAPISGELVR